MRSATVVTTVDQRVCSIECSGLDANSRIRENALAASRVFRDVATSRFRCGVRDASAETGAVDNSDPFVGRLYDR